MLILKVDICKIFNYLCLIEINRMIHVLNSTIFWYFLAYTVTICWRLTPLIRGKKFIFKSSSLKSPCKIKAAMTKNKKFF